MMPMMTHKERRFVSLALAVMAWVLVASIPFDVACEVASWTWPDFEVRSSILEGSDPTLRDLLEWVLRGDFVGVASVSVALAVSMVACRGHEGREDMATVALACMTSLSVLAMHHLPFAIDRVVVAAYAPLCYAQARVLVRHLGRRLGFAMHLANHLMLVTLCAWDGAWYCLAVSVPTVAWMALCWTLFALPTLMGWEGASARPAHATLWAALTFVAQMVTLSAGRILEILGSLTNPAAPEHGWTNYNWLVVHLKALAALPTSEYRELVADPWMLDGLQRLPLAWLGVAYGPVVRLAYAVLILLFLAASWVVWQDARSARRGRMVEVLALGVLLSNLWGVACSILSLTSTGVSTLLSQNPYQLVPLVCLLVLVVVPDHVDPMGLLARAVPEALPAGDDSCQVDA